MNILRPTASAALLFALLFLLYNPLLGQIDADRFRTVPFSVDETHITVWNGDSYVPLFIKGVNLGVGVPGTFPGEMAATRDQYMRWFEQMHELGFNSIRVYTLHFPHFYSALREYNLTNPQYPILLFHGVWLEEEVPGYNEDLFTLTDLFDQEMRENVSAVHGDITIPQRFGKAHGRFDADVSEWVIGYIIGREVYPSEVIYTNEVNSAVTGYEGRFFSIQDVPATEAWFIERLDRLVAYEVDNYGTQRPVSFSSWPTLDPMEHPTEQTDEDIVGLDISGVDFSRAPAGIFASYHAYPYYPDYISRDPRYQAFSDHLGQNSYLGYLTFLKAHYNRFPLIIAEYGAPSSWGNAHYAHNGIHHGGYDELEQGGHFMRMLQNIHESGSGGGMMFSWLDEWFKQTWIVNPMDFNPDRRILWHNVTAAEQNYGLIGFRRAGGTTLQNWETFCADCEVRGIRAGADYAYLKFELDMERHLGLLDTLWVALDTYRADLGESMLPNGTVTANRAEFVLMITHYKAELYVTEAYDIYGIWHGTSSPQQQYRSTVTDGAPWRIVRWKNNQSESEVQFIGSMRLNKLELPPSSMDAVRLFDDRIEIRLPFTLLNIVDPSSGQVMHFERGVDMRRTMTTDGIHVTILYRGEAYQTSTRYIWPFWEFPDTVEEYKKDSYFVVKNEQRNLPGNPIARGRTYTVGRGGPNMFPVQDGVLINDLSPDGTRMVAVLDRAPEYGLISFRGDGSFMYTLTDEGIAMDQFTYRVRAGAHWSEPATVVLLMDGEPVQSAGFAQVFPNPASEQVHIRAASTIDRIDVYNSMGQRVATQQLSARSGTIQVEFLPNGVYFVRIQSRHDVTVKKISVIR